MHLNRNIALSMLAFPFEAVLAHHAAHVCTDETGAPGFFGHGVGLIGLPGFSGKIDPLALQAQLGEPEVGHRQPPAALSLTQATEYGSVYTEEELRHLIELTDSIDLTTVAYRTEFQRNWYKLNDVQGVSISSILADPATYADQYAWISGQDSPANALRLRNNNRSYYAQGLQSVLGVDFDPETIRDLHKLRQPVRYGDGEDPSFLESLPLLL